VVLIDVEIAARFEFQVEPAVLGEQFQHVVEEPYARRNLVPPAALDAELGADLRLFRVALDARGSHRMNSS
jgi:hypothetical protein